MKRKLGNVLVHRVSAGGVLSQISRRGDSLTIDPKQLDLRRHRELLSNVVIRFRSKKFVRRLNAGGTVTSPYIFDMQAFGAAVDERRRSQHLSWSALAIAIWEQSHLLNARDHFHPISPATIRNLAEARDISCQHALFLLRWLGVPPETFISSPKMGTAQVPLPAADGAHRLRWDIRKLYDALNEARNIHGDTWQQAAAQLDCTPNQLAGLRIVKFAISMRLAMRITQSLHLPAANFVYAAEW